MGRIRTIKPEFTQSESIGRVSREARLLFLQVWTVCDDYGRCRAAAPLLAGLLYPYDADAAALIPAWLDELAAEGLVRLYRVDGSSYLEVPGWAKHQRVDNAGKPMVPPPPAASDETSAAIRREPPRTAASLRDSRLDHDHDLGPSTAEQRADAREPRRKAVARPEDVPEQVWQDWLALRKGRRAAVTETALAGIRREATKAGLTLQQALEHSTAQGWQGFRADWLRERGTKPAEVPRNQPNPARPAPVIHEPGNEACGCDRCESARRHRETVPTTLRRVP